MMLARSRLRGDHPLISPKPVSGSCSTKYQSTSRIRQSVEPIISPRRNPRRFGLAASLRRLHLFKAEPLVELFVRLTVDLDIRVDEVIERWTILLRRQLDVAAGGELHAIGVNAAEEIIFFLLRFPRLGDVNWDPAGFARIELSPAVITGYISFVVVFGEWKTDVEAGRNPLNPQYADERRMKICTVAALGVTCPHRVPASPA